MLFKNLKSGNFVEAKDAATIEMMEKSPIYEEAKTAIPVPAPVTETAKPVKKPATKTGKTAE